MTPGQFDPNAEKPVEFLLRTGRFQEAMWVLDKYAETFPPEMGIFGNLAICNLMIGNPMRAMEMAKKALEFEPTNAALLEQLGRAAMTAGEYDDSIAALRTLVEVAPAYVEACGLLGMALRCERRFDEAYAAYRNFELANGHADVHVDNSFIFTEEMDGRTTLEQRLATRKWWYDKHKAPWKFTTWSNNRDPDRPLTIGYISGDFRTHSAAYAFKPLILNRNRDEFKIVCISVEGSVDPIGQLFKDSADVWLHMPSDNDEQISWAVRNQNVDILVDLSGHTPGNRLRVFTTKPAPIQISMIGFIGTTGVPEVDYVMVDEGYVPKEEADLFVEKVWNLPSAIHFQAPDYMPEVVASPCVESGYITYGCYHHFSKITDEALQTWAEILRRVPTSKFIIKDDVVTGDAGRAKVLRNMSGIDPSRIVMENTTAHDKHLADHGRIDVSLDTWPQCGGVTTLETIGMGVPVLSVTGDRIYQRGCLAVQRHLPEDIFITNSVEEYVERAVALADQPGMLASERFKRRSRIKASPLGDTKLWVRSIEDAYRQMWRTWVWGEESR